MDYKRGDIVRANCWRCLPAGVGQVPHRDARGTCVLRKGWRMTPIMAMLTVALCGVAAAQAGQAASSPGNAPTQLRERVAQSAL